MQLRRDTPLAKVSISVFVIVTVLSLLAAHLSWTEEQTSSRFILWRDLQTTNHMSKIKIDPKREWVAQLDWGWSGWLKVWELKGDLTIGEKVLDIGGRKGQGFFVKDIEWVGGRLLISIIEGYDTLWEWDKQMEEGTFVSKVVPWQVKWLLFDPKTRQIIDLGVDEDLIDGKLFAHPSGDKVLIVKREFVKEAFVGWQIKIVSLLLEPSVKPEIVRELSFPYKLVGDYLCPVGWMLDGQNFWVIGADRHGLPKLFAVRADGSVKMLTPDDHHLNPALCHVDGIHIEPCTDPRLGETEGVVTPSGEYAILMMFPKPEREHVCLAYYSQERLERKKVLLDVNRPYPSYLKPLGVCKLVGMVPDGRRLIIQEGWFAPYGEKKRVWVWDIQAGTVKPLAQVGWIEKVYGWIGTEWMVVGMRGELFDVEVEYDVGGKVTEKGATYEYGLLYVPKD